MFFTPCSNDSIKFTLILYNFVKPDFTVLIVLNPVFVLGLMIFKNDLTRKLTHF